MGAKSAFRFAILALAGLSLAGCGVDENELKQIAAEKRLGKVETAAFVTCAKQLGRKKPRFEGPETATDDTLMSRVPHEVCLCHARTMAQVFKEDKFASHSSFADYIIKDKKKFGPMFRRGDLKTDRKTKEITKILTNSLLNCATTFRTANPEEAAEIFQSVPKPPKKKKKEEKTAGTH